MTRSEFQVEKTAIGLQYVIPGTKRIVKPKPRAFKADYTPAGDQFVIPGAEKISTVESDISQLTFKSMAIVSTLHRHGNSIPFAALR